MKQHLYSVLDKKAGTYSEPHLAPNGLVAARMWRLQLNQPGPNQMSAFPDDFDLMQIGSMDLTTGALTPETPVIIATATQLLEKPNGQA